MSRSNKISLEGLPKNVDDWKQEDYDSITRRIDKERLRVGDVTKSGAGDVMGGISQAMPDPTGGSKMMNFLYEFYT